jgi:WD40 repeat protein
MLHTLRDHTSGISAVAFSPDGKNLASESFDDEIRLWCTDTWKLCGQLEDFEHDRPRKGSELTYQGSRSVLSTEMKGRSRTVTCLARSPDCQVLVSGSMDTTIKL